MHWFVMNAVKMPSLVCLRVIVSNLGDSLPPYSLPPSSLSLILTHTLTHSHSLCRFLPLSLPLSFRLPPSLFLFLSFSLSSSPPFFSPSVSHSDLCNNTSITDTVILIRMSILRIVKLNLLFCAFQSRLPWMWTMRTRTLTTVAKTKVGVYFNHWP